MDKINVLHVLRSYSLHGGERQIANSISGENFRYKQIFLNFYKDTKVRNFFRRKKIEYYEILNIQLFPKNFPL